MSGEGESFTISLEISDGEFSTSEDLNLVLGEALLGGIMGVARYAKCQVPIPGVMVSVFGNETQTDENGEYRLEDVTAGKDTIRATKEDFGPVVNVIDIPVNSVVRKDFAMTSIPLSTKVFGTITDQDGKVLTNAEVVVLNPNGSESNLTARTDEHGIYRIQYIPHGEREIIIRKEKNDQFKYSEIETSISFSQLEERHDFILESTALRGRFVDIRDGQDYPYITIGEQTWMTLNLAYLPRVNRPEKRSETEPYFYVYDYDGTDTTEAKGLEKFWNYGVLYNWEAAQRICPFGWHLPDRDEWYDLFYYLDSDIANKLRSQSGWADHGDGSNSSGFSAVPGGRLNENGVFSDIRQAAFFQTSTSNSPATAYVIRIYSGMYYIWPIELNKQQAFSVRCVRD